MVFVGGFAQGLDPRRKDAHAVLDVSLHVRIVDTSWQEALDQVLHLLGDSELGRAIHIFLLIRA